MRLLLLISILLGSQAIGLTILMAPNFPATDELFNYPPDTPFSHLNPWQKLHFLLKQQGVELHISNLKFLPKEPKALKRYFKEHINDDTKYLIIDYHHRTFEKCLSLIPKEKIMLFIFEPPAVFSYLHTDECYSRFSKVFTWDDARVNGNDVFKYNYFVMNPMISHPVPFSKRKFCCVIAGNKKSKYPFELYSERKKALRFFEANHPNDLDLYGSPSWGKEFKLYKGNLKDKCEGLKNYKFSICYENTTHILGYITEKIFDCFAAGVIPIYWGADNITDYIPKECFIDKRNFPTYEALYEHLANISEDEFNTYLKNIQEFLSSDKARSFTDEAFVLSLTNGILGTHLTFEDLAHF